MSGLGAWFYHGKGPHKYYVSGDGTPGPTVEERLVAGACQSIKNELRFLGFEGALKLGSGSTLGWRAIRQIKKFQTEEGLDPDGVVGPLTAEALWRRRLVTQENEKMIPDQLLRKLAKLESGFDPAAQGVTDPNDFGLFQINLPSHPQVHVEDAIDVEFAAEFGAQYLVDGFETMRDWDGALAAYNLGTFYAAKWVAAGKPASLITTLNGKEYDYGKRATHYVALVKGQKVV